MRDITLRSEGNMQDMPRPDDFTIDGQVFQVLINAEEQYSIWPAGQPAPEGWAQVGPAGAKAECLAYVDANWLDMRPKSLRDSMQAAVAARGG
nr:MbtH family NRPS accessory protein [uncultured Rhodopila sp.]